MHVALKRMRKQKGETGTDHQLQYKQWKSLQDKKRKEFSSVHHYKKLHRRRSEK